MPDRSGPTTPPINGSVAFRRRGPAWSCDPKQSDLVTGILRLLCAYCGTITSVISRGEVSLWTQEVHEGSISKSGKTPAQAAPANPGQASICQPARSARKGGRKGPPQPEGKAIMSEPRFFPQGPSCALNRSRTKGVRFKLETSLRGLSALRGRLNAAMRLLGVQRLTRTGGFGVDELQTDSAARAASSGFRSGRSESFT